MIYFPKPKHTHKKGSMVSAVRERERERERERALNCYHNQEYIRMTMTNQLSKLSTTCTSMCNHKSVFSNQTTDEWIQILN